MPSREVAALYNAPKPRQEWVDGQFVQYSEDEEAWVELFIDLVYVVLLSKLADIGEICMRGENFYAFKMCVIFCVMCMTRQAIDEYSNRFYSHDLTHKLIYLIYTIGVFTQVLNIGASSEYGSHHCQYERLFGLGMAVGVLITRASLIAVYALVVVKNIRGQRQFTFDLSRFFLSAILMAISIGMNESHLSSDVLDTVFLTILVVQEFLVWVVSRLFFRARFTYPIDLDLMQSRWGNWVMIVIGESIIQMLYQSVNTHAIFETYGFCIMAVIMMFSLAMQYYDACQCEWYNHALTKSALAGICWIWLHVPMSYFLFGVGASLKVLIHSLHEDAVVHLYHTMIISKCLGITTLLMTFIRLTNNTLEIFQLRRGDVILYSIRVCLSALQFSVYSWFSEIKPLTLIGIQMAISLALNILDIWYDICANPNSKRVFALSTRVSGMGVALSRKAPSMSAVSRQVRRPSRPWATANLAKVKSDKSDSIPNNSMNNASLRADNYNRVHPRGSLINKPVTYRPPQGKIFSGDEDINSSIGSVGRRSVASNISGSSHPAQLNAVAAAINKVFSSDEEYNLDAESASFGSIGKKSVSSNHSQISAPMPRKKKYFGFLGGGNAKVDSASSMSGVHCFEYANQSSDRSADSLHSQKFVNSQKFPLDDLSREDENPFFEQTLIFDGFMYRFVNIGPPDDALIDGLEHVEEGDSEADRSHKSKTSERSGSEKVLGLQSTELAGMHLDDASAASNTISSIAFAKQPSNGPIGQDDGEGIDALRTEIHDVVAHRDNTFQLPSVDARYELQQTDPWLLSNGQSSSSPNEPTSVLRYTGSGLTSASSSGGSAKHFPNLNIIDFPDEDRQSLV